MQIKNIQSVIFSPCGGTRRVMRALTKNLTAVIEHDLTLPEQRTQTASFGSDDLTFIGFPVYGGRPPALAAEICNKLSGAGGPAVLVAVYGNRDYDGAFIDMQKSLSGRGFKPFAAVAALAEHSMVTDVASGRPDSSDNSRLAEFGRLIVEKFNSIPNGQAWQFSAPGPEMTNDLPLAGFRPSTNEELCNRDGECVLVCPNGAINADEPYKTDPDRCIGCQACVQICPQKARAITNPETLAKKNWLIANCQIRREAELFF